MTKKVLLDTNVIIHRERMDSRVNPNVWLLFNRIEKCWYEKWIHPDTKSELENYDDKEIVKLMKDKIKNYSVLKNVSDDCEEISKIRLEDKTQNSINDTNILKEVFNKRVDFLITQDKAILRKAEKLWIDYKVYDIDSFLDKLTTENPEFNDYKVLSVRKKTFWEININDSFFDSLKNDYKWFIEWFNSKSQEPVYVCYWEQNEIQWFLYLKVEDENEYYWDITPQFSRKKRLKIWTFKVSHYWYKLWERFLKIAFDNAIIKNVDEIYLTIFNSWEEKERLISLISDRWFEECGKKWDELVFVRDFRKNFDLNNPLKTYPYISRNSKIFVCPILKKYHTEMFPDSILTTESPWDFIEWEPHRNSIRKIYISSTFEFNKIHKWDIILIYMAAWSRYLSVITSVCVVEDVIYNISSLDELIQYCKKRSLFTDNELKERREYKPRPTFKPEKNLMLTKLSYNIALPTPKVNLDKLLQLWILKAPPRSFTEISREQFDLFIKESRLNESYIVD